MNKYIYFKDNKYYFNLYKFINYKFIKSKKIIFILMFINNFNLNNLL